MTSIVEVLENYSKDWIEYEVISVTAIQLRSTKGGGKVLAVRKGDRILWNSEVKKIVARNGDVYAHDRSIPNALKQQWIKATGRRFADAVEAWQE